MALRDYGEIFFNIYYDINIRCGIGDCAIYSAIPRATAKVARP